MGQDFLDIQKKVLTWRSSEDGPGGAINGLACSSSRLWWRSWCERGRGRRAMWAATKAAEVAGGRPASRPAAADEGGIPCCRPTIMTIV